MSISRLKTCKTFRIWSMCWRANTPNVGFCYDCSHHFHFYPTVDLLAKFGSRLMALHLHDYDDADEVYRTHRLPFDGVIDWASAMAPISQSRYQGTIAIEAMNWEYEMFLIEQFLHEAYQRAKRLEALRF
ncbi:MAG: TIM barrel protein [Eubacteriales bacterium]